MLARPDTRYATTADGVHIAYQVTGDGPMDLLFNVGLLSHVEVTWDFPGKAAFYRRLSSFGRLIRFDKRGSGLSDPVAGPVTLEQRTEDMRAVLDAVGSETAVLLGVSEGGAMSLLFAASHPERTSALVLFGTGARFCRAPDYPHGLERDVLESLTEEIIRTYGKADGPLLSILAPSLENDSRTHKQFADFVRQASSPGQFAMTSRLALDSDVRAVLPTISAPTLVIHRVDELFIDVAHARYLAEHIDGAKLVELPGADHMFWVNPDQIVDEIESFLVGARGTREPDRMLTTIMFTDIVASTARASELGDSRWGDVLDRHDRLVRRQLEQFSGRELDTAGDGFVACFDGPARAVRCAQSILAEVKSLGVSLRAGLHTGECEIREHGLAGIAMHVAARVSALAGADEVLVSGTVRDLVIGSGLSFTDRGLHTLKGVPESWRLYAADPK